MSRRCDEDVGGARANGSVQPLHRCQAPSRIRAASHPRHSDCPWSRNCDVGGSYAPEMTAEIRVGTCSWADEALTKAFYPQGLPAAERLAWYAEHFDTVEVDSTYYRLPVEDMVRRWAERTPDAFVMHVKAFGVMTRHPVKARPAAARPARGGAGRRPRPRRAALARVPRRDLPPLPRGARAAARRRQARRDPAPVPALRRAPRVVVRLPRVRREPARRRRPDGRVPAPLLVRGRSAG